MDALSRIKKSVQDYISFFFVIRYILLAFILFFLAFTLIRFPESSADGVRNGITLCLDVLVPTLYPFMILANIFVYSGIIDKIPSVISKITELIFRLPGECTAVIVFSMVGGLPIGAKMIKLLYEKEIITAEQGQRMLYFCINPGPAFIISSVGFYMLGSKEVGILIYISLIASSLTVGIITRFIGSCTDYSGGRTAETTYGKNFIRASVNDASKSILSVCSWVVAFSCITEMIKKLNASESVKMFLMCITEMTNGCKVSAENLTVPIIAGVIGFSGICAHFQLMDSIIALKMKYKYFITGRIINGSIAAVYCSLLLKWFPVANETFSAGIRPTEKGLSTSFIVSVFMVLMAVLFIVGDDYSVKIKEKIERVK